LPSPHTSYYLDADSFASFVVLLLSAVCIGQQVGATPDAAEDVGCSVLTCKSYPLSFKTPFCSFYAPPQTSYLLCPYVE
jgi:hypothetical protein